MVARQQKVTVFLLGLLLVLLAKDQGRQGFPPSDTVVTAWIGTHTAATILLGVGLIVTAILWVYHDPR